MPRFNVFTESNTSESLHPIFAKDLDEATAWAEDLEEMTGLVVTRIQPVINHLDVN